MKPNINQFILKEIINLRSKIKNSEEFPLKNSKELSNYANDYLKDYKLHQNNVSKSTNNDIFITVLSGHKLDVISNLKSHECLFNIYYEYIGIASSQLSTDSSSSFLVVIAQSVKKYESSDINSSLNSTISYNSHQSLSSTDLIFYEEINDFRKNPTSFEKKFKAYSKILYNINKGKNNIKIDKKSQEIIQYAKKLKEFKGISPFIISYSLCRITIEISNLIQKHINLYGSIIDNYNSYMFLIKENISYFSKENNLICLLDEGTHSQIIPRLLSRSILINDSNSEVINFIMNEKFKYIGFNGFEKNGKDYSVVIVAMDIGYIVNNLNKNLDKTINKGKIFKDNSLYNDNSLIYSEYIQKYDEIILPNRTNKELMMAKNKGNENEENYIDNNNEKIEKDSINMSNYLLKNRSNFEKSTNRIFFSESFKKSNIKRRLFSNNDDFYNKSNNKSNKDIANQNYNEDFDNKVNSVLLRYDFDNMNNYQNETFLHTNKYKRIYIDLDNKPFILNYLYLLYSFSILSFLILLFISFSVFEVNILHVLMFIISIDGILSSYYTIYKKNEDSNSSFLYTILIVVMNITMTIVLLSNNFFLSDEFVNEVLINVKQKLFFCFILGITCKIIDMMYLILSISQKE